tara:strand:- start:36 stop:308 length:273 start_codon:yes stop_codon:yes gene_type:complete
MTNKDEDYPYNTEFGGDDKTPEQMEIMDMQNKFHFAMRNKDMEYKMLENRYADLERENKELRKIQLDLVMENGELKDMVLDLGGDYTENK